MKLLPIEELPTGTTEFLGLDRWGVYQVVYIEEMDGTTRVTKDDRGAYESLESAGIVAFSLLPLREQLGENHE